MRLKLTLTLLVILLGLLTYIFYIDPWGDSRTIEDKDRNAIASLAVDIDFLRISNAAHSLALSIELKEDGWMLTEPYRWPANTFAVERILNQLQFLDTKVSFDADRLSQAGTSLKEYGLEPPETTLEFGKDETAYSIGIGNATAVGNHLYLLSHDQSKIHVVDRSLLDSLLIELETLRNPRIFKSSIFEVESWNIQLASNLRTRITKNNDLWILETPIRARADSIEVNTLLGRLLEFKSQNIVQPTPIEFTKYGLSDPPFLRIAIETNQSREALEVGDPVNADDDSLRWAKLESRDTVFELEIDYLTDLETAQTRLRDRRIFEIDTNYATSISFDREGQGSFDLQKLETGEWDILSPDQEQGIVREKGSSETVDEALSWLSAIQAVASDSTGFVHDAPTSADLEDYGLEVPAFSISIASTRSREQSEVLDPPQVETLLYGDRKRNDRSLRYVKLKEKDFVYLVSNDTLSLIADQSFEFQDRNLFDLPDGARVSKIAVNKLSDGQILLNKSDSDPEFPLKLSKELESFSVKSYLQNAYASNIQVAGKRQPWAYSLNITFVWKIADTEQSRDIELYLSELTGGPLLIGGSIESNTVFEFRQPFVDAFSDTVFDRVKRDLPDQPFDPDQPLPSAAELPANNGNQ